MPTYYPHKNPGAAPGVSNNSVVRSNDHFQIDMRATYLAGCRRLCRPLGTHRIAEQAIGSPNHYYGPSGSFGTNEYQYSLVRCPPGASSIRVFTLLASSAEADSVNLLLDYSYTLTTPMVWVTHTEMTPGPPTTGFLQESAQWTETTAIQPVLPGGGGDVEGYGANIPTAKSLTWQTVYIRLGAEWSEIGGVNAFPRVQVFSWQAYPEYAPAESITT